MQFFSLLGPLPPPKFSMVGHEVPAADSELRTRRHPASKDNSGVAKNSSVPVIESGSPYTQITEAILKSTEIENLWNLIDQEFEIERNMTLPNLTAMSGENLQSEYFQNNAVINQFIWAIQHLISNRPQLSEQAFSVKFETIHNHIRQRLIRNDDILKQCHLIAVTGTVTAEALNTAKNQAATDRTGGQYKMVYEILTLRQQTNSAALAVIHAFPKDRNHINSLLDAIAFHKANLTSAPPMLTSFEQRTSLEKTFISKDPFLNLAQIDHIKNYLNENHPEVQLNLDAQNLLIISSKNSNSLCKAVAYIADKTLIQSFQLNAPSYKAALEIWEVTQKQNLNIITLQFKDDNHNLVIVENKNTIHKLMHSPDAHLSRPKKI